MLWKQLNPGYRRLLRDGDRGGALIVSAETDRVKGRIGGLNGWNLTVRVKFGDGTTADFERYLEASAVIDRSNHLLLDVAVGNTVPIRFDPANRSRVEIDTAQISAIGKLEQAQRAAQDRANADAAIEQAERNLKPIDPPS